MIDIDAVIGTDEGNGTAAYQLLFVYEHLTLDLIGDAVCFALQQDGAAVGTKQETLALQNLKVPADRLPADGEVARHIGHCGILVL